MTAKKFCKYGEYELIEPLLFLLLLKETVVRFCFVGISYHVLEKTGFMYLLYAANYVIFFFCSSFQ